MRARGPQKEELSGYEADAARSSCSNELPPSYATKAFTLFFGSVHTDSAKAV